MKTGKFAGFETEKNRQSTTYIFKTGKFAGFEGNMKKRHQFWRRR